MIDIVVAVMLVIFGFITLLAIAAVLGRINGEDK